MGVKCSFISTGICSNSFANNSQGTVTIEVLRVIFYKSHIHIFLKCNNHKYYYNLDKKKKALLIKGHFCYIWVYLSMPIVQQHDQLNNTRSSLSRRNF